MDGLQFLTDKRLLALQAVTAWLVLLLGTIMFATISTLLSTFGLAGEQSLMISFLISAPLASLTLVLLLHHGCSPGALLPAARDAARIAFGFLAGTAFDPLRLSRFLAALVRARRKEVEPNLLGEAMAALREVEDAELRASLLVELAPSLSGRERTEAIREAIAAARAVKRPELRASLLAYLDLARRGYMRDIHRVVKPGNTLLHQDIKPGNILLTPGPVRLGDFGIVRVGDFGMTRNLEAESWDTCPSFGIRSMRLGALPATIGTLWTIDPEAAITLFRMVFASASPTPLVVLWGSLPSSGCLRTPGATCPTPWRCGASDGWLGR